MKRISYFCDHNLPRDSEAIMAKFWVTSKDVKLVICLRSYNALRRSGKQKSSLKLSKILEPPTICNPKSSLKLSNSPCSPWLIQSTQISTCQVSCQAALYSRYDIFHISMLITCVTQTLRNFYISMLRVCTPSRLIPSFPCSGKCSKKETGDIQYLTVILSISYYTK